MRIKENSPEVHTIEEPIIRVGQHEIEVLKKRASETPRKRMRYCAHPNVDDPVHEMLIVIERGSYIRPHKHQNKSESFHIIEGTADVIVFDDAGEITDVVALGPPGSERNFYYRLGAPLFHTLRITSERLVFHETTTGPFDPQESVFPQWAPDESDGNACEAYMADLGKRVDVLK
jgi:cupin fold WbuC family metalloprotein